MSGAAVTYLGLWRHWKTITAIQAILKGHNKKNNHRTGCQYNETVCNCFPPDANYGVTSRQHSHDEQGNPAGGLR
jgi:hypothetical protein